MGAAIEQLLTPHHLSGRQGDNQQNDDAKYTYFSQSSDGHRDAPVRYCKHRPMEEVQDLRLY
jgi:hypothetical protein